MTQINRLQQILAQIRSTLAARPERTNQGQSAAVTYGTIGSASRSTTRPSIEELKTQVKNSIADINLIAPDGRRTARRVFLESILLAEFGVTLANDPRFMDIVSGVQDAIEEDVLLLQDLDTALDQMQS